jgi:ABC-type nickel/cobalt efflux system permease component RcnA
LVAYVMLVIVVLHVTSRSVLLVLTLSLATVMRLVVTALVVVFVTTRLVSVLVSPASSEPDASIRQL